MIDQYIFSGVLMCFFPFGLICTLFRENSALLGQVSNINIFLSIKDLQRIQGPLDHPC